LNSPVQGKDKKGKKIKNGKNKIWKDLTYVKWICGTLTLTKTWQVL
jgi:hypothetical protein